jgi:hypothetical protein
MRNASFVLTLVLSAVLGTAQSEAKPAHDFEAASHLFDYSRLLTSSQHKSRKLSTNTSALNFRAA